MDLSFIESTVLGFVSGLSEILPVSARAHNILLLKLFGADSREGVSSLLVHLAVLAAIYLSCRNQIVKVARAKALARIPKKRRKRPLDTKSLMDFSFWRTMVIPVVLAMLFYRQLAPIGTRPVWLAAILFLNGLILYIPQFFPSSNKDCRSLTRLEGVLMGLGGACTVFPGMSGMGSALSVGSVCGVDRSYALTMTLMLNMVIHIGLIVYDILAIIAGGIGPVSVMILLQYIVSAAAAFFGAVIAIRTMRTMAANAGYSVFSYYCWGVALFIFILNLMA